MAQESSGDMDSQACSCEVVTKRKKQATSRCNYQTEEKTEVLKRVAIEAKYRQWKSFCDTLKTDTTLTPFCLFLGVGVEGGWWEGATNTTIPDLIDTNGVGL